MQTIICPHCKKEFELSQALEAELKTSITDSLEKKHAKELEQMKEQVRLDSVKKLEEKFSLETKQNKEELLEKDERIKELIEQMTSLTKELRESKREKDEAKLEMERKLAKDEEKIRLEAQKKAEEDQHNKLAEKDKQIQDAMKEIEDMKRKLQLGSQQLQGEAFELEFENLLEKQYPNDIISPVKKGVKGGDIVQEVVDSRGNNAGKILWELKNTKLWSEGWVDKLKSDKRLINAEEGVLISEILPSNMKTAGFRNSVWVTQRNFVIPLADTLRAKLIQLHYTKNSVKGKDEKMEILYSYLSGTEFKHRVEAIIDAFTNMQQEIEKEKRYFSNKWARDEKNIRQVIDSTYGMHGDLKGLIGNSLPQIKGIDTLELEEEKN